MKVAANTSAMGRARYIACALLLLCPLALSRHDDDFGFENNDEFQVELTANHSEITRNRLRRLWGVPDSAAYVGHLFRLDIPKEAFSGDVMSYQITNDDHPSTPSWLAVDSKHGIIAGIPEKVHLGGHTFTVTAHGRTEGLTATDNFIIEVMEPKARRHSSYGVCTNDENRLVLVILVDKPYEDINPKDRIRGLLQLSRFLALAEDEFWIEPYKIPSSSAEVIHNGSGSSPRKTKNGTTGVFINTGCHNRLWNHHKLLMNQIPEQAKDGSLEHTLRLPVSGWRLLAIKPPKRKKRQSPQDLGSGDRIYDAEYDDEDDMADYSGYDDTEDYEDANHDVGSEPDTVGSHPHRHHHGEPGAPDTPSPSPPPPPPSPLPPSPPPPSPSPSTSPSPPTEPWSDVTDATESTVTYTTEVKITPYSETASETTISNVSIVPASSKPRLLDEVLISAVPPSTTTEADMQTVVIRESNELPVMTSSEPSTVTSEMPTPASELPTSSEPPVTSTSVPPTTLTSPIPTSTSTTTSTTTPEPTTMPTTTPLPETTLQEVTKQDETSSTEGKSTIIGQTTETITFAMPENQPPVLIHHMKKLAIPAGKAFRYIIPADVFMDPEEKSNLTFTMYEAENVRLGNNSWIQFIPAAREVYGLPLEAHVSRWNFIVEAQDSEGLQARGPLDLTVQQHRSGRTINHQFTMQFKLEKQYTNAIDWQIRALEGIVNLFRDTDMDHLTVLNATQKGDLYEFVWTNDTLPKDPACPMEDIKRLMKILESPSTAGGPSAGLSRAMSPELAVVSVAGAGAGRCAARAPPRADTYPPVSRNQVDSLTATQGVLFIYKVPEDTFYDPEDGNTRNLQLSLRYSDRTPLPPGHWLQFDHNNQEFYGLPSTSDEGTVSYQLIAEDSSKKSAYDSLIVEVVKAAPIKPTVEFQMTMEYPYAKLAYDANNKRKVVEKLAALFGRKDTDNIRITSISNNPTTIIWYNTSLPMDRCPKQEIEELRKMIIDDGRTSTGAGALRENVDTIFDKDFKVMSIRLIPLGLCAEHNTKVPKTSNPVYSGPPNSANSKAGSATTDHSYLVTFIIPAVVIVCMILLAGIIACVLYRRRRTGKMSVGDEEERQAFRSKGIPVIFQDELEERGEESHKSPVIMREEKPPLLPPAPEYDPRDAPYRPPPPFAPARTPPRPKATPTYRKPPPYVPP